jgi:hypothetical protein
VVISLNLLILQTLLRNLTPKVTFSTPDLIFLLIS